MSIEIIRINGTTKVSSIPAGWAENNLPVTISMADGTIINYRYNADGQRVYKKVGAAAPEFYLKDGDRTVAVLYGNGSVNFWNMYGNNLIGRMSASGKELYYLKNNSRL